MADLVEQMADLVNNLVDTSMPMVIEPTTKPVTDKEIPEDPTDKTLKTTNTEGAWQSITTGEMSKHIKNLDKALKGTPAITHDYLKIITYLLINNYGGGTILITSGKRTGEKQARVMIHNWKRNGGATPISEKNPAQEKLTNKTYVQRTAPYKVKGKLIETLE
jgi:hypothetical protein